MCSLVMSLCLHDLHVTSLNNNYYNTLNSSRLTVVQLTQCLIFGWYNINLFLRHIFLEAIHFHSSLLSRIPCRHFVSLFCVKWLARLSVFIYADILVLASEF